MPTLKTSFETFNKSTCRDKFIPHNATCHHIAWDLINQDTSATIILSEINCRFHRSELLQKLLPGNLY